MFLIHMMHMKVVFTVGDCWYSTMHHWMCACSTCGMNIIIRNQLISHKLCMPDRWNLISKAHLCYNEWVWRKKEKGERLGKIHWSIFGSHKRAKNVQSNMLFTIVDSVRTHSSLTNMSFRIYWTITSAVDEVSRLTASADETHIKLDLPRFSNLLNEDCVYS